MGSANIYCSFDGSKLHFLSMDTRGKTSYKVTKRKNGLGGYAAEIEKKTEQKHSNIKIAIKYPLVYF